MEIRWPLLKDMPRDEVVRVLSAARRRSFSRHEVIFHEGDHGDALHLIDSGKVAVKVTTPTGDVATLLILGPGEFFGELALLDSNTPRTATVTAIEAARTLSIARTDFDQIRASHPQVTEVLVRILAEKVKRYTNQLMEALYVPADLRVLRRVLELADAYAASGISTIPLTQQDLAGLAGTSRATVNRVLREEMAKGNIRITRGRTTVVDREAIEKRAY